MNGNHCNVYCVSNFERIFHDQTAVLFSFVLLFSFVKSNCCKTIILWKDLQEAKQKVQMAKKRSLSPPKEEIKSDDYVQRWLKRYKCYFENVKGEEDHTFRTSTPTPEG